MLCLKKRRTYSFTQGACNDIPRRSTKEKNGYNETLNIAVTTLPRKHRSREERTSGGMVLTVTEDTPADMLAGSMELLVQLPRDHNVHTQRVTVPRSTPMMDLLVQIATAHKLSASSYTLQAIGERGIVLPHQPNTPIGALDALQVKLLPKQGTFLPRKAKQANQPFETTFRLQVLLPRNQLYVTRVSPKMNLGKILEEVCREKNLDRNKYELRHPANLEETLDLSLSLQDYHLQEVTLYAKQGRTLGAALSSQDIMALQRQEERRRQQAKQSVFGFMFRKSKESSLSIDSLGGRSVSPARSDETGRSVSPLAPPSRPLRKRRPAPKPPVQTSVSSENNNNNNNNNNDEDDDTDETKEKLVISHSRNSSDSSGYHEASVLSDNPDSSARMPETLPRRSKPPCKIETSRKLAQTSQSSKSLGNLAMASGGLSHGISSTSISSTGIRKKRAAPPPPMISRPLSSAISSQALERIIDSEESLTSDIDISKSPSDIATSSKANSDIGVDSKANSDIGVHSMGSKQSSEIGYNIDAQFRAALADHEDKNIDAETDSTKISNVTRIEPIVDLRASIKETEFKILESLENNENVEIPRVIKREIRALAPTPKPRSAVRACQTSLPIAPRRNIVDASTTSISIEASNDDNTVIDRDNDKMSEKQARQDLQSFGIVELRDTTKSSNLSAGKNAKERPTSTMLLNGKQKLKKHVLKHVKSMDDIYALSMNITDDEIDVKARKHDSLSRNLSCAVISTIPKCAHLTPKILMTVEPEVKKKSLKSIKTNSEVKFDDSVVSTKNLEMPKRLKIFRSQSAINDFNVNPLEKKMRYFTSHSEDFNCALNPNFSRSVINLEDSKNEENVETKVCRIDGNLEEKKNIVEDIPPFVVRETNLGCQEDSKVVVVMVKEDSWEPQLIEQSASGDRSTETDILLQKVSDTLSNSLPLSKPPLPPDIVATIIPEKSSIVPATDNTDETDEISENLEILPITNEQPKLAIRETKNSESPLSIKNNRESPLSTKSNVAVSCDVTLNSQQDTSDYVSATGDDLSITDWEYQLPAPPSAFRDNITPDFDGYDTITLRSIEAFKESSVNTPEQEKIPIVHKSIDETTIVTAKNIELVPKVVAVLPEVKIVPSTNNENTSKPEKPKSNLRGSSENRKIDVNHELKKDIINELATKIENGSLSQTCEKISEQDTRRTTAETAAPKIAPVDNTLSNFTITTYSRQKSLNIFDEEETNESKRNFSKFTNPSKKCQDSETLTTCKAKIESGEEKFSGRNTLKRIEDDSTKKEKLPITRTDYEEHAITKPEVEFKKPESKIYLNQHDSLLRSSSVSRGTEKFTNVHRSKSYITLANNAKYRENLADDERLEESERMENNDGRMMKSTSVTNLNHDNRKNNEKFSQWRENILKRQEEPSKEKQLQSIQVLKNILPRLKSNQQTDESVTDSSNERENSTHTGSNPLPEAESIEPIPETRIPAEPAKPQKSTEETTPTTTTPKRYKYTGPPAISLGSWSERPRVNVQLKMDKDYKFASSDNNTSGAKTCVNLNGVTSNDKPDVKQQIRQTTTLPRNFTKSSTTNGTKVNQQEINNLERRESEDQLAKKLITHTTATGFKKPALNRIVFSEVNKISLNNAVTDSDREQNDNARTPVVTSVALKKSPWDEKSKAEILENPTIDDDVKIDTKSVNFRQLTKTFGQEVCLRTKPRNVLQNRHSDYYGTRPVENSAFSNRNNEQTNFWNIANKNSLKHSDSTRNPITNGAQSSNPAIVKRYTSIVGIQGQNCNNNAGENVESSGKNYTTSTMMNGLMPVVKGFKIPARRTEDKEDKRLRENAGEASVDSSKKNSNVPLPPTMPIITGVTLKNSSATRPKSMPICNNNPRDQLFESIRNFGGREGLKSVIS